VLGTAAGSRSRLPAWLECCRAAKLRRDDCRKQPPEPGITESMRLSGRVVITSLT
jgi:hypothetical protein